jgi:hypothetical protein
MDLIDEDDGRGILLGWAKVSQRGWLDSDEHLDEVRPMIE